jgi:hypothetical protein
MKERTILQRITDTLEAAGITVSAIETWSPDEEGRVSVSLMVWLPAGETGMNPEEDKAEAVIAALNKARDPSRPPVVRDPCADCGEGGCDTCPTSPANSTPIELYDPEEARAAMKAGRILKGSGGETFYYSRHAQDFQGKLPPGFYHNDMDGVLIGPVRDFSGLYLEAETL